jgi:hypothetical protein
MNDMMKDARETVEKIFQQEGRPEDQPEVKPVYF